MKRLPRVMSKGTMIYGKVLSLASDFAVNSYGHFVIDSLARLKLFYDAGYNFDHVDYIFCPKPTPGNAEILFNKLGIPVDKCIWADDNRVLRVETLIAITFPGTRRNYPSWVTEFLQSRILPTMSKPRRRLYISRTGYSRNIENEHEIFNILKRYDFEIYNPTDNENSHLDFAEAAVVIGISGSALTGLAFCQAGTKVLELMGTDHVYPYYYTLSDAANLQYNVLVCQSSHERRTDAWGPSPANIYVDEKEFEAALREFEQTN
jgi:capsular polysaccharide biosynthesis protein